MQGSPFSFLPRHTPVGIKLLLWIIAIFSLAAPLVSYALAYYFSLPGPQSWLPLSRMGLDQGWLWQPITYPLISSLSRSLSISFLISLFFQLFLLWFTAIEVAKAFSTRSFFFLFFTATLFSGLIATGLLYIFASGAILFGLAAPLFALLMVWTMLYPDLELAFFFLFRIKAKWLITILVSISLLMTLSYGQPIPFVAHVAGILWGFLWGRLLYGLQNPFTALQMRTNLEDDEAFMQRMLDKISNHGLDSLSMWERKKMDKISKRRGR